MNRAFLNSYWKMQGFMNGEIPPVSIYSAGCMGFPCSVGHLFLLRLVIADPLERASCKNTVVELMGMTV